MSKLEWTSKIMYQGLEVQFKCLQGIRQIKVKDKAGICHAVGSHRNGRKLKIVLQLKEATSIYSGPVNDCYIGMCT